MNTLIVTGGTVDTNILKKIHKNFDFIIASDHGLEALNVCKIIPNYIIGDFDSIDNNLLQNYSDTEIVRLNPEKDYTDTHMALKKAIEIRSQKIVILGATGSRIDHLIGNIHILKEALENNIDCKLVDSNNEIFLINKDSYIKKDTHFKYISLIPLTTTVTGITLKGFKYSLNNACLRIGHSIGISNEQISDGIINIDEGILIIIRSKDWIYWLNNNVLIKKLPHFFSVKYFWAF